MSACFCVQCISLSCSFCCGVLHSLDPSECYGDYSLKVDDKAITIFGPSCVNNTTVFMHAKVAYCCLQSSSLQMFSERFCMFATIRELCVVGR